MTKDNVDKAITVLEGLDPETPVDMDQGLSWDDVKKNWTSQDEDEDFPCLESEGT